MANGDNTQDTDYDKIPLNRQRFTSENVNILSKKQKDAEVDEFNPDTEVLEVDETGTVSLKEEYVTPEQSLGEDACTLWEPNPLDREVSQEELKTIIGLKDCKNLPESDKDKKDGKIGIELSRGKLDNKERLKIEIYNEDEKKCAFIESIRVIIGTSDSYERDLTSYTEITKNSPFLSEEEILDFVNSKVQITDSTPSSLIDGASTNIPPCLSSTDDKIGILLGPSQGGIQTGVSYVVGKNLPPGADNLIGFIGATGVSGMSTHIHAEWANIGDGTKYWTPSQFATWRRQKFGRVKTGIIKTRTSNGRGQPTGLAGCAAYFTVKDLLEFIDVDMLPLEDQIAGKPPLAAKVEDFIYKSGGEQRTIDRNYAEDRTDRYHYAIDVYPNAPKGIKVAGLPKGHPGLAVRRMFKKPNIEIVSFGGSNDGTTGNAIQLRNPATNNAILIYHMSAIWDNNNKQYITFADNVNRTLYNGDARGASRSKPVVLA